MLVCKNKGREKIPLVLLDLFFVDQGKHFFVELAFSAKCKLQYQTPESTKKRFSKNTFC